MIEIYGDSEGQWRWRFKSKGGRVQADSGQGYSRKADCIRGLERVTGGWYVRSYQGRTPDGHLYQQGDLFRWNGPKCGSQPEAWIEGTFVEVLP